MLWSIDTGYCVYTITLTQYCQCISLLPNLFLSVGQKQCMSHVFLFWEEDHILYLRNFCISTAIMMQLSNINKQDWDYFISTSLKYHFILYWYIMCWHALFITIANQYLFFMEDYNGIIEVLIHSVRKVYLLSGRKHSLNSYISNKMSSIFV